MRRAGKLLPLALTLLTGTVACEHLRVPEPSREVECVERARVSLTDAIAIAEANGGKALDADYREDQELGCLKDDPGVYDITLASGGRISVLSVNARSGQVGPREEENIMDAVFGGGARFEGSPADMEHMLPDLAFDISQAIRTSEHQAGKAMSAWIEAKDGKPGYTVKVVENGRVRVTWVDGTKPG